MCLTDRKPSTEKTQIRKGLWKSWPQSFSGVEQAFPSVQGPWGWVREREGRGTKLNETVLEKHAQHNICRFNCARGKDKLYFLYKLFQAASAMQNKIDYLGENKWFNHSKYLTYLSTEAVLTLIVCLMCFNLGLCKWVMYLLPLSPSPNISSWVVTDNW